MKLPTILPHRNPSTDTTSSCYYSFNVTVPDSAQNHPAILTPVHCSGSLDDDKDYVTCGHISQTQSIAAYIVKDTNELKLRYNVENPTEGSYYSYFGEKRVYAATSADADKQKSSFEVTESKATGVA